MDVVKCFDKLWYAETANDLYNAGVQNDHFVTVANSNDDCGIAVKMPSGSISERKNVKNIEMQGTVITSLKCSIQMDTLGPECLDRGDGMYKYKNCLPIPPLGMVDDVLAVAHCGTDSAKVNAIIQSKMATKKLELGQEKCFQIHVGKESSTCPQLNVHQDIMKTTSSEKYLGDIITNNGKIDLNIEARVNKANGSINSILSLLEEISFGKFYFQMAILFRNSMLINSVLCSSETLFNVELKHVAKLEACDKKLLTKVFSVPSTTSFEAVYLETGCLPCESPCHDFGSKKI